MYGNSCLCDMRPCAFEHDVDGYQRPLRAVRMNGTTFVFREIGKKGGVPVVFLHHLTAVLDDWDPRVVDGLAAKLPLSCSTIVGSADPEALPPKRSRRWLVMPSRS
jgi:hypothetical protein